MNKNCSFRVDGAVLDSFQVRYPYVLSKFLRICIEKALSDKSFFDTVYFGSSVDISRRCDKVDIVDLFKKQSSKN